MSIVFTGNTAASEPQTHALVIGVGDYPHLRGGTMFKNQPALVTFGLGQLTSSVKSAEEFANWLRTGLSNPAAPLGSVELLLSPGSYQPPAGAPAQTVDTATLQNIKNAFNAWYQRIDANKDNVAILYYSGHGMEVETTVLLCEDFGDPSSQNIWEYSIDFDATWSGMAECSAKTQCYFIDACRETSIDALKTSKMNAYVLKTTQLIAFPERDGPVLKAAPLGWQAHGPQNGSSYFTQALVKCLGGLGASHLNGSQWVVTTDSLSGAMLRYMKRIKNTGGKKIACAKAGESNFTTEIHEVATPALVMAQIVCNPEAALSSAMLAAQSPTNPTRSRTPDPDPWETELETGQWDILAQFPGGSYRNNGKTGQTVYPPYFRCVVDV